MSEIKIVERVVDLQDESEFINFLYRENIMAEGYSDIINTGVDKVQCVYIEELGRDPGLVVLEFLDAAAEQRMEFKEYIRRAKPTSLLDTQFMIEFYCRYYRVPPQLSCLGMPPHEALERLDFKPDFFLDGLLADTRGILMWNHQLEQLLQFIELEYGTLFDLRKHIGHKKAPEWKRFLAGKIGDRTLEGIVRERAIFHWTMYPPLRPAYNLWKYLINPAQ